MKTANQTPQGVFSLDYNSLSFSEVNDRLPRK
nr:MAG TPA: hypothetical protein [Caudoviricetes sp.]